MPRSTLARLAALLVAVAIPLTAAAPGAQAATVTACVKTKGGDVKIRSGAAAKKACPKGWKKVRWSTTGPKGAAGPAGPAGAQGATGGIGPAGPSLTVRDANGASIGVLVGVLPQNIAAFSVFRDGGVWTYLGSGELLPIGGPSFTTADCSGTPYLRAPTTLNDLVTTRLFGGTFRLVFRTSGPGGFGPVSAYTGTSTIQSVAAQNLYDRNQETGACELDASYTGKLITLTSVTPPPDAVGPLTLS